MKKIPSKLNRYKGHAEIKQEMSEVVWNSHSKDSFDRNWNEFLLNFGLVDNKWLSGNSVFGCILQISMKTVIYGFQSIWITTSGQG
ncbi:hypothetical protein Ahy_A06g027611 [Arachis hypogaea]|uniref:Protein FAR1-RELATED SEQUENCE n=1 Tax=Arachis hypogaea TaxID=3818 RepID=A0A445CP71_ARAHY|nr:hypothetical protein Ahy_A06g027611 [Arachis hypogaea]